MNKHEAKAILKSELEKYRKRSYDSLLLLIQDIDAYEVESPSGISYQLEIQVMWDEQPNGNLRVLGSIDDGGFISSFVPICESFILTSGGQFVDE